MKIETLEKRLAAANATMISLNDEMARLQAQARTIEAALLETNGQRKELMFLIRELEPEGPADA